MKPEPDVKTEWLLTNGLGGYAMGTAAGINTRRYHGLLVASMAPPVNRMVCLHSTIDQFHPTGEENDYVPLSTQMFGDDQTLHPDGWQHQVDFTGDAKAATWTWTTPEGVTIRRTLSMEQGDNACLLEWTFTGLKQEAMLTVRPMAVMRSFHELMTDHAHDLRSSAEGRRCYIQRNGMGLILEANRGHWEAASSWWDNFDYPVDAQRGQDHRERVFCGGVLRVLVSPGETTLRVHVAMQESQTSGSQSWQLESSGDDVADRLAAACNQFVVSRGWGDGAPSSVIAGYPWFADWGRDSLISMPGLYLQHGRLEEAISLLSGFASRIQRGIIPNRFDDSADEAYYNTADASLWFIDAVCRCIKKAGGISSHAAFDSLLEACRSVIKHYRSGTDYGIRIDFDGLVMAGIPGAAVTWMDARVDGQGVTPRIGKPVELSALWHNALCSLGSVLEDPAEAAEYQASAALTRKSFRDRFWNQADACCYDVLIPSTGNWRGDAHIRPNQLLAMSLPHPPLTGDQAQYVLDCVRRNLLTPYGLRTLAPTDPEYRGRYEGDMESRDRAYHNGTVWPWLMGAYCDGLRKIADNPEAVDLQIRELLSPLVASLDSGCLGQVAEIYDGDEPHLPHGCPAQAWSVAELTRSWPQDIAAGAVDPDTPSAATVS
ncbi:MAG: amylo-alpha-1,6-glucosidase [Phycisphaerales bacterium]|nr:amylo-alpha-1,6-glucosidase [Phycisphaerales bacterium]